MADKKFSLTFDVNANMGPIKGAIQQFQNSINSANFKIPVGIKGDIDKTLSRLNSEIENFESMTSQGFSNMADISKAEKSFTKITSLMRQLGSQSAQIKGLDPNKLLPKEIQDRTIKLQKAFEKLGSVKTDTKKIEAQTAAIQKQEQAVKKLKTEYDALAAENIALGQRKGTLTSSIKAKEKEAEAIQQQMKTLEGKKGGKSSAEYSKLATDFRNLNKSISAQKQEFASLDAAIAKNKSTMSGLKVQYDGANSALTDMQASLAQLQAKAASNEELEKLRKELAEIKNVDIGQIPTDLEEIKEIINSLNSKNLEDVTKSIENIEQASSGMIPALDKANDELDRLGNEGKEISRVEQDIENLKNQVFDFFSITNTVQIFKNAIRDAFDTVKELDAAMTETAVVTDFSIGDMWDKLPEYSDQATQLGTSIRSLYEATTLYYQQGLNSEAAMGVGVETMKMARIAGMDAAAATEAMTAALRGFNMEINEMSATRINDVYSELAAITAADTSQIATAMSKTASIAASANMEFETTAALLAQIIETTQEAPETAGTAMKTIIARFTEVKELFGEGLLTGKDSEGEEININKIDAALKTVGISLRDFLVGTKGIDDIFLELASKWDTLDLATQRYIATAAAGSRQQSRFLAMMSNYDRTMELVNAATNSAGASQRQFGKTLDSLDAKLQRLQNAWDTFVMGLADSDLIKGGVDLLTALLDAVNNVTESFDGIGNSVAKVGIALAALKTGKGLFNMFTGKAFSEGAKIGSNFASGIVSSLSGIDLKTAKTNLENNMKGMLASTSALSSRLMLLGMGFKLVAQQMEGTPLEEYSEAVSGVGTAVLFVAGAMKILIPMAAAANMELLPFIGTLVTSPWGIAVGAILAIGAALYGIYQTDPSQVLKKTEEYAEEAGQAAEEAAQKYNELKAALAGLSESESALNEMVVGTQEWRDAVTGLNEEILNLIEVYPELAKLLDFQGGHLVIDYNSEEGQQIQREMHSQVITKQIAAIAADAAVVSQDENVYYRDNIARIDPFAHIEGAIERVAEAAFENRASFKDETSTKKWLRDNGLRYYAENGAAELLYNNIEKLSDYGEYLKSNQSKMQSYDKLAQSNLISQMDTDKYDANVIDLLGKIQVSTSDYAETWREDNPITESNFKILGKEYAEALYGQGAKLTHKGLTGEIVLSNQSGTESRTIPWNEFINEVAYSKGSEESAKQLKLAADSISEMSISQQQILGKLLSQDGQAFDATILSGLENAGVEGYLTEVFGSEIANNFDKIFGLTFDSLAENAQKAEIRIAKQRENIAKRMAKYSTSDKYTKETGANELAGLEAKYGEWIRNSLEQAIDTLELSNDSNLVSAGLEYFKSIAILGTEEQVRELEGLISQIDLNDPIEAADLLSTKIEKGSDLAKGFSSAIQESGAGFLGVGTQFETLINNEQYEELNNSLQEIYKSQGEITESDISSLASEYSALNKMLKNTSATGSGLAKILTSIYDGKISFDAITDAILAAVGGMDSLGESTDRVLKKLEELELGDDFGVVQDKYTEFADMTKDWQSMGEYGNEQYENLLNYFFGSDWDVGYENNLIDRMDVLSEIVQATGEDMTYLWDNASKGMNIFGEAVPGAIQDLTELGIGIQNIDGEIVLDIADNLDFDFVAENLAEALGGTKELWEDLLVYFESRDPNFKRSWLTADYDQMGKRIAEDETTVIGGKKVVTQTEVDDIVKLQSEKTAKAADDILTDLQEQLAAEDVVIVPELGELDATEVTSVLNDTFDGFADKFATTLENGASGLNLSGLYNSLVDLGLPSEIATQVADGMAQGAAQAGQTVVAEINGELQSVTLNPEAGVNSYVDAMNTAIQDAQAAADSAEISSDVQIGVDQAAWQASVNEAKSYIDGIFGALNYSIGLSTSFNFGMFAKGIKNNPNPQLALTGEEGPELVETKDGAYLVGTQGPQMAYIGRGDTVHTAQETKEIYKRQGLKVPAYKGGTLDKTKKKDDYIENSEEEEEKWENPFDKLYNLVRKIDEELRQRERLERRYEKLLESIDTSANKIIQVSREELAQLEKERMLQEKLIEGRKDQISDLIEENADLTKYANVTQNERGEDVLRINWDLIDAVTDTKEGEAIEEYVSQLEEWFDELTEAEDALWDIEDAVAEIKERGEDQYFDLEGMIKDALVQSYQDEIDKLSEINTSINDTNASLLDAMQKTIDKQRQDRDNQRTEDDLAEKQRRLLYLQQDTSGANAMEILKLQEEIAQGQEDYTDSLIDQKISELQQQNDEAAKQREQQITIAQAQLDYAIENGLLWDEIYSLMDEGLDPDNGLIRGSQLETLLKSSEGFKGMSELSKMEWLNETNDLIAQALAYLELGRQLEDIGVKAGTKIKFTTADGKTLKGTVDDQGNVTTKNGKVYNNVYQGYDGKYYARENIEEVEDPKVEDPEPTPKSKPKKEEKTDATSTKKTGYKYTVTGSSQEYWNYADAVAARDAARSLADSRMPSSVSPTERQQILDGITIETIPYQYKKGGLADFTGPAWLDGTKSKPELVLNARDTENFIQLKNILGSLLGRSSTAPTENNGDITYDIDINVESIGSDYDVDQIANKIKNLINDDARYRNNNAVSLMR